MENELRNYLENVLTPKEQVQLRNGWALKKQLLIPLIAFPVFYGFFSWASADMDAKVARMDASADHAKAKKNPWAKDD